MPRPRSFDEMAVLRTVMFLFWQGGFCATSMDEIENKTGVLKPSLYRCFGKKEDLFLKSYDLYETELLGPLMARLDEGDGRTGLKNFYQHLVARLNDDDYPKSCFSVRIASESPPVESIRRRVAGTAAVVEDQLYKTVRRGQLDGSITSGLDPRATARMLMSALFGITTLDSVSDDGGMLRDASMMLTAILSAGETKAA